MASNMLFCFILVMNHVYVSCVKGPQGDCTVANEILTCEHTFPTKLLSNISSVVIKDYLDGSIVNTTFSDASWSKVTSLVITVNTVTEFKLEVDNFIQLKTKLTLLGIHAPRLRKINRHSFRGLTNLRTLDLSHSVYLNETEFISSVLNSKLQLTTLNLSYISSSRMFQIDRNFMQMITETKLERLSLSGTNVIVKGPLNIETMKFDLSYFDISNTSISFIDLSRSDEVKMLTIFAENLKDLDMSYIKSRFLEVDYNFLKNTNGVNICYEPFFVIISKVQNVFLNGIYQSVFIGNNSQFNLSTCNINLKSLHMKDNNIHYLNSTMIWPKENDLQTIDFSENHMTYLNPDFFTGLTSLEFIDLSTNKLGFMETYKEFSYLFTKFRELRFCNLSQNKLTFIPRRMFEDNAKLIKLDLSNNDLTSVTFDLDQFKVIQVLRLKNNRITFLKEKDFMKLNLLLQRTRELDIGITGNPIECSCKSIKFLKWMLSNLQPRTNSSYTCQLEGKTYSIDETAIEKSEYLCVRNMIIITVTCVSVVAIMVILAVPAFLHFKYKRRKREKTKETFLLGLRRGTLPQKFICFLSFSSSENYNFISELSGSIDGHLRVLAGIKERTLICVGDRNFRLGYAIVNEIYRVVNQSFVMLCLVSRAFCASRWCNLELRMAKENNIKIILIFIEEVPRGEMPVLLQNIFDTSTRAKVVIEEGECIPIPEYDILCESIFNLALDSYASLDRETSDSLSDVQI